MSKKVKNTAKKPKMLRECLRSLLNRENNQEAQNAKEMSKKLAQLGKTVKKPKMLKYCLRSLQNHDNGQEAKNVKTISKKPAKVGKPQRSPNSKMAQMLWK